MGAETSKLAVQERFNALSRRSDVAKEDEIWDSMFSAASSDSELTDGEFFGMINVDDVRRIWINQPDNFELLVVKLTERIEGLTRNKMVGTNGTVASQISNCCRILTRVAPIIYESDSAARFADVLKRLIDVLKVLLHYKGFTTPLTPRPSPIWSEGIACPVVDRDSVKYNCQRIRVIRALLSVLSAPLYSNRDDELEYFTTTTRDPAIICSLLNTSLMNSNSALATLSLCLLVISLTHLARKKNQFRKFVARIRGSDDLDWLSARLKHLYLNANDKTLPLSLLWELVQANGDFASRGGELVDLAGSLSDEIEHSFCQLAEKNENHDNETRLRAFVLLSMTANNHWCAEVVGPKVLTTVVSQKDELLSPTIELATLVDVLWNCAPSLVLTDEETNKLKELRAHVCLTNSTVDMVIISIIDVMKPRNPQLETEDTGQARAKWNPIQFQWDPTRFRWYQSLQWGHTYQSEPRVWSHTNIKLFRVAELKPKMRPVELMSRATSLIHG